jgi:hypothetical protein
VRTRPVDRTSDWQTFPVVPARASSGRRPLIARRKQYTLPRRWGRHDVTADVRVSSQSTITAHNEGLHRPHQHRVGRRGICTAHHVLSGHLTGASLWFMGQCDIHRHVGDLAQFVCCAGRREHLLPQMPPAPAGTTSKDGVSATHCWPVLGTAHVRDASIAAGEFGWMINSATVRRAIRPGLLLERARNLLHLPCVARWYEAHFLNVAVHADGRRLSQCSVGCHTNLLVHHAPLEQRLTLAAGINVPRQDNCPLTCPCTEGRCARELLQSSCSVGKTPAVLTTPPARPQNGADPEGRQR